jgi:hypothetical protein
VAGGGKIAMTKLTRFKTLLLISFVATGCGIVHNARANDKYLVISAVQYTKKYSAFPDEEKGEIPFTVRHGKATTAIVAPDCQAWDIKNNCAQLKEARTTI